MYGTLDSGGWGKADVGECERDAGEYEKEEYEKDSEKSEKKAHESAHGCEKYVEKPDGPSTAMRKIVEEIEAGSFLHGRHMQDCLTLQISSLVKLVTNRLGRK